MAKSIGVVLLGCALVLAMCPPSQGTVMISEIMYNPNSTEAIPVQTEWIEIYNYGTASVDISGWYISDEDGASSVTIPAGTFISPGEAIVLFPSVITVADFQAAWGTGFTAFPMDFESLFGLSNSPSPTNEILVLRDALGNAVDTVNYDDAAPWPLDTPDGPSIHVLPGFLNPIANDNGANWARSQVGVNGAFAVSQTLIFNGNDAGSPGVVVPEPGTLVALGIGLASLMGGLRRKA
ncbi:MAG: hypothetical protein KatS3mg024_0854 [Armatimonadota bacterium]|nr:MAG: hypothetical protein KatS3mg024_0854 [Armatimonadota bacterium]